MRLRTAFAALAVALILIVGLQVWWLSKKVRLVESPELYAKHDFELKADQKWRYGYALSMHGASLVKTVNRGEQFAGKVSEHPDLRAYMRRELGRLPSMAIREGLFYLAWVASLVFLAPWAYRKLVRGESSSARKGLAVAALSGIGAFLFLAPMITAGYGSSAFTTWAGPYAISSSGPYAHLTWWPGETISYRPIVELLSFPMMKVVATFGGHWILLVGLATAYGWIAARLWSLVRGAVSARR
ncbi:MAG: hypothetical protein ACRD1P_00545 [Thermoanaerobaculia bacterium]